MALSSREKKILSILYESPSPLTISNLARLCEVTIRTIKNDIENIKNEINSDNLKVMTKTGVGVWIEINDKYKEEIEKLLNKEENLINPDMPDERMYWITRKLIETDGFIAQEEFANQLYVSKSTINKDFIKIEEYLKEHNIKLMKMPKYGTKIAGSEKNIRILNADILKKLENKHEDIITEELKLLISNIDLEKIKNILLYSEEKFNYALSDISIKGLLIHLAISIQRIMEGKLIIMNEEDLQVLRKEKIWEMACYIGNSISKKFSIEINEFEIGYIAIHLMGAKLQNDIEEEIISKDYLKKLDLELYENIEKIIKSLSKKTGYNFQYDEKLFPALFLHLRPAINRAKYNIKLDNPFLKEIKKDYSTAYEIAAMASDMLSEFYNLHISDHEIGYVALHFGAAIERQKGENEKTAVIICATGIGTSQLLLTKFTKQFKDIKVLKVISVLNAAQVIDSLKPTIILSTVPFTHKTIPVVNLSPLLNSIDIKKIELILSSSEIQQNNPICSTPILNSYIDSKLILINKDFKNKKDIIRALSDRLKEFGYVRNGFMESVLEREKFSSTAIGNFIAIPHSFGGYISKSKIALMTLNSPIKWGSNKVQLIFMIALDVEAKQDFRRIFEELEGIISDENRIKQLIQCKSINEIMKLL